MLRRYDINNRDGDPIGVFEFDDLKMAKWLSKQVRYLKRINNLFKKYGLNMEDLNPDGSGKTMAAENAVEMIEADMKNQFYDSPGNIDIFFGDRRPLALVESGLYIGHVFDKIGSVVLYSLKNRR